MIGGGNVRSIRAGLLLIFISAFVDAAVAQISGPPTTSCHSTDGKFTVCPNGQKEWSDVQPLAFPATNSYLYVNQDASHSFLYLLYDFPFRTSPIAATESVHVSFDTVSQDSGVPSLEEYDIYIFGNGTMQVLEQGQPTPPGRIMSAPGFGTSPNSATPHLMAELQVPLTPGPPTAYSPDPLFWSATVPPNPPNSPPPPDPCPTDPGKTYNRCVKAELNNAIATANDAAAVLAAGAVFCSTIGALGCAPLEPGLAALSAVWWITAAELGRKLGADPPGVDFTVPPDPNFTVIAQPAIYTLSLPTFGLTPQETAAFNAFAANAQQLIALEQAAITALARVEGASLAGNTVWVNNQMQAARKLGGTEGALLAQWPGLLANIGAAIKTAGIQFTFTPSDILKSLAAINPTSPPSEPRDVFGQALQQLATQVGVTSADRTLILQLLSSVDAQAAETLGTGTFPGALSDPVIATGLGQLGTGLVQNAPSSTSLTPSVQITLTGDYVAGGVGLRGGTAPSFGPSPSSAPINISTVPGGATVVRALLYWGMLDNGFESSLGRLSLNGTPVEGALLASGPDTCWGRSNSFTFRADVTPLVAGNGTYTLTGFATGGSVLPEGASLVVIYQSSGLPTKTVMLADGNVSIPLGISTATTTFTGFTTAGPVSALTTFMVGDGQANQFGTTPVTFTGNLGTLSLPGLFAGNVGPLWDTDTFNVGSVIGPGSSSDSVTIRLSGDCLLWSAQAFSVTTATGTTPVTGTAAIVQANVDGDTVVQVRGLAPTDAPTLQDQIQMIVQSRIIQNPSTSAVQLVTQLVNSLPPNILPPGQAANLINAVTNLVVLPPVPADTIPPTTTATPSPGPNANDWNNTNVTVALNSVDNSGGSGVKQISITLTGAQTGSFVTSGATASVAVTSEGVTTVTYFATDNAGNQEMPKTLTVRIDKTFPIISGMPATGCSLWPPNQKLVEVATVTSSDAASGMAPGTFKITGTSNEPVGANDPKSPDILITPMTSGAITVQLRADRLGSGNGRVYTLTATASDLAGNTKISTATCTVPHDQSK